MTAENSALIERVKRDPEFRALERRRSRLAWTLSAAMVAIYFGFILTVAFEPGVLAMTIGVGVILAAFVLTGLYVRRANTEFDRTTESILERLS